MTVSDILHGWLRMRKLEELRYRRENVDDRKENWFEERAQNQEKEILVIVGVLMWLVYNTDVIKGSLMMSPRLHMEQLCLKWALGSK